MKNGGGGERGNRTFEEIEIDLPDSDLLALALMAHERDITLNDLMVEIITEAADRVMAAREGNGSEER